MRRTIACILLILALLSAMPAVAGVGDTLTGVGEPSLTGPVTRATAQQQAAFIAMVVPWAQAEERVYGVPAADAIAQAADESTWGENAPGNDWFNISYSPSFLYQNGSVMKGTLGPFGTYATAADAFLGYGWYITHDQYFIGLAGTSKIDCRKDLGDPITLMHDIAYDGFAGGPFLYSATATDHPVWDNYYNVCVGIINYSNLTQYDVAVGTVDPNNIYFDPNAGAGGNGSSTTPFNDFGAALAAVNAGGTIHLRGSTTWTGTITKAVTLVSEGGSFTIGH